MTSGFAHIVHTPQRLTVTCDRCNTAIRSEHYHCLQCNDGNYDVCLKCIREGLVCQNYSHDWIVRSIDKDGKIVSQGRNTTARRVTEAQTSFPVAIKCPNTETERPESLYTYAHRFIRKCDCRRILIFTDGACPGNGQSNPQAGYCFVYRPSAHSDTGKLIQAGTICGRLENRGSTGVAYKPTSNRAELRAVIAALQFRDWGTDCGEEWMSIIIATDSE